ncbi:hypothetical protein BJ322DRAFT_1108808 [Thelephora terrestris]|uniref:Uncharacterized protein n=1 Tax=Thelephora terrestris TaxID=56493 RepID=A0A9P6L7A4_9AGAM|nr:hypothetical protein BJ322DRAFT_1108808 [Thelephora terrestris]
MNYSVKEEADRHPHVPPPCSPKVIYSLAVTLDIRPLRDLALKEIRSRITSTNVVNEFFAGPMSRLTEVMKMQYELLRDKFNNQDTNASAVDLIKSIADGTRAHHGSALKYGLRKGFSRTVPPPPQLSSALSSHRSP